MTNYCIDVIRKDKKRVTVGIENYPNINIIDDDLYDNEIKETNIYRLKEILEEMDPEDRSVLMMKYQDDLSIKEISEIFNKSESAVKMKIFRAKERFMKFYSHKYEATYS